MKRIDAQEYFTGGGPSRVEAAAHPAIREVLGEDGQWCNQPDGAFEQDDAIRAQGGAA